MARLIIDQLAVEVPEGATLLEAARKLGIDVPTLCYVEGYEASTSCLVCMVKVRGTGRLVPACGTKAEEGMEIESETDEVRQARRTALELLLSDHVGDCLAPCHFTCPAHMDIPVMLRQISAENLRDAIATVKETIALPAVLGRICPKPCEKGCRRHAADGAVAVCQLKRFAADADLASEQPYRPECRPATGKRVAVVGAGPTGLSAAYYLRRQGHAVTIFDDQPEPGGRLRRETTPEELPRDVLDAEIGQVLCLDIDLRLNTRVGAKPSLDELRDEFDAVLVACGSGSKEQAQGLGLRTGPHGILVDKATFQTGLEKVFAAGNAIRARGLVVRSAADGHEAARAIDHYLASVPQTSEVSKTSEVCGSAPSGHGKPFSVRMGRVEGEELHEFVAHSGQTPRAESEQGFSLEQAVEQASRCLHCDCRGLDACKLRRYAALYGADPARFRGQRRAFRQIDQHSEITYEPGKCIFCGLCIQIASARGEPLGLSFVGRGFDVRVGVPFNRSLEEALSKVAAECVAACPTAALAFKDEASRSQLPILGQ
jgi:NADPH-dependent glutamate synthase beta subunit-like oxidoreductase/ferredoxin